MFRTVNYDPTGDDNYDSNGWRGRTRLGANDRTAVLIDEKQLQNLEKGELRMNEVRDLYRRSLKLPNYLPFHNPTQGYNAGVEAKGKLLGLTLLPIADDGLWNGIDNNGNLYEVAYNNEVGLSARRVQ